MTEPSEGQPQQTPIIMPQEMLGGVWANFAAVRQSKHEFTLDFMRADYEGDVPVGGVVVARVNMSPLFVSQLLNALGQQWQVYVENAMPKEIRGDGEDQGQ